MEEEAKQKTKEEAKKMKEEAKKMNTCIKKFYTFVETDFPKFVNGIDVTTESAKTRASFEEFDQRINLILDHQEEALKVKVKAFMGGETETRFLFSKNLLKPESKQVIYDYINAYEEEEGITQANVKSFVIEVVLHAYDLLKEAKNTT